MSSEVVLPLVAELTDAARCHTGYAVFWSNRESVERGDARVRIGRSALNEICLPSEFVSRFHAVVHFGEDRTFAYLDHGALNGSIVDGVALDRLGTAVSRGRMVVQIGDGDRAYKLVLQRRPVDPAASIAPPVFVGSADDLRTVPMSHQPPVFDVLGNLTSPDTLVGEVLPILQRRFDGLRSDVVEFQRLVAGYVDELPSASRAAAIEWLAWRFPLRLWDTTLYSGPPHGVTPEPSWDEAAERALLLTSLLGVIELDKGVREAQAEFGVRPPDDVRALPLADPDHLAAWVLARKETAAERVEMVRRLLGDLLAHQVAILAGFREGVESLLASLQRDADADAGQKGFLAAFAPKSRNVVSNRIADLLEGGRWWKTITGDEFRAVYLRLVRGYRS